MSKRTKELEMIAEKRINNAVTFIPPLIHNSVFFVGDFAEVQPNKTNPILAMKIRLPRKKLSVFIALFFVLFIWYMVSKTTKRQSSNAIAVRNQKPTTKRQGSNAPAVRNQKGRLIHGIAESRDAVMEFQGVCVQNGQLFYSKNITNRLKSTAALHLKPWTYGFK